MKKKLTDWEHGKNTEALSYQTLASVFFISPPSDSDTHKRLRTTAIDKGSPNYGPWAKSNLFL